MGDPPAAPDATPIREFGLLYSRFCNAACDHCGSSSSPAERGRMPMELVERCLDDVAGVGIRSVLISGGEPLAFFPDIRAIAERAQAAGLGTQVCSNGFFGDRPDRARSWLGQLRDRGLEQLLLSTDRFHLAHIDLDRVIGAARAAEELDIPCQIAVPATARDWQAGAIVARLRRETSAQVQSHPVHPIGRGEGLPPQHFRWPTLAVGPCHLVGHIEVDHEGTVSVCPTSADFDPQSPLVLGDVATEPLAGILARFQTTPLFAVIARWGPLGLHVLAHGTTDTSMLGLPARLHDCHLCRALTTDAELRARVRSRHGIDLLEPAAPDRLAHLLQGLGAAIASGRTATTDVPTRHHATDPTGVPSRTPTTG